MTRTLAGLLLLIAVIGCSAPVPSPSAPVTRSPAPPPAATPALTLAPATVDTNPMVDCHLTAADCGPAAAAVLAALGAATTDRPTLMVLDKGIYCPDPSLLFSVSSCPAGAFYSGGVLVTLAGTTAQAYLDLKGHGPAITAHLIAIAVPPPTPTPGSS